MNNDRKPSATSSHDLSPMQAVELTRHFQQIDDAETREALVTLAEALVGGMKAADVRALLELFRKKLIP